VNVKTSDVLAAPGEIPERVWWAGVILIFLIGGFLRLYHLTLVPLHHDEGVNGNFLVRLVRDGIYKYDPENYHGPTLYYFAALIPWTVRWLFGPAARETYGLTTFTIRFVPAFFGLATIALIFLLRRRLGSIATLTAALLLAISPGAVYLSRYFIHETHFVFFTLAIVVSGVYLYDKRNPVYLVTGAASAALLFATKETAMISVGVLIIALAVAYFYMRLFGRKGSARSRSKYEPARTFAHLVNEFGGPFTVVICIALSVAVGYGLYFLFYTSFFTNPKGLADSLQTFRVWSKTGSTAHVHPVFQYILWLFSQEAPLLVLGSIGAALVVFRPRNSFALFSALWAFGLIAAYSLIPYKTPWLLLNFLIPLALIAGYAVQALYEWDHRQLRLTGVLLFVVVTAATYQTIDLNFFNYDNDDSYYVYVYAHTTRGMLDLVNQIDRIAKEEQGGATGISIMSPDYWPLPWYLRNYSRVGYFADMAASSEPMIIAGAGQRQQIEANFGELYGQVMSSEQDGSFELRPGVRLLLYQRRKGFFPPAVAPQPRP
jgi:uncharacterized protein (TIGR03663 family)